MSTGLGGHRLTVYVAHHRARAEPSPEAPPYIAVCNVRADSSRPSGFDAYDDDGGLPELNRSYNELSVLHRLQTRADTEFVGLAHYRRVLLAARPRGQRGEQPGTYHITDFDWRRPERCAADEASLVGALDGVDWVTSRAFDVRRAGYRSVWDHFVGNHPADVLRRADAAVQALHPELEPLETYLRQATATPLYNVFLGRREVLQRYGAFLWPVLTACGRDLSLTGYQGRWGGFLGERLHGYWLAQVAVPSGVRIGDLPLGLLDLPVPPGRQRLTGLLPAPVSLTLLQAVRRRQRA